MSNGDTRTVHEKMALLRHRMQLARQAEDAAVAAGAAYNMPRGRSITPIERASIMAVADMPPPPPEIDPELEQALRAYAEAQQNEQPDEELTRLFGGLGRVARFCQSVGLTLVDQQASQEAIRYVNLTVSSRFVTLWFDQSGYNGKYAQEQAIRNYVQAMRTAISRLRSRIRASGSRRLIRQFGITLMSMQELEHCHGLFRVVIDSRADRNLDKIAVAFSASALDALTIQTPESMMAPSPLEQQIAARSRGIKPEE